MIDLTPLLEAVVALAVTVITCYLIPFIKSKMSKETQENLEYWIDVAVKAAEQKYKGSGKGQEKKQFVIDYLEKKGFTIDADKMEVMIESLVYDLKNNKSEVLVNGTESEK